MALIPITFKADITDNQKGNIRPEDLGAILSFLAPNTAGVLNISGQDCKQFGTINIVGNTAQITFHKGYILVYGRACYIEEGTQVAFNLPASGSVSGGLGIKINLAETQANEVKWFQKTTDVQTDNLLSNPISGVYEFVLYNYTATTNSFTLGDFTSQIIENIKDNDFTTREITNKSKKIATTEFVNNYVDNYIRFETINMYAYLKLENSYNYPAAINFIGYGIITTDKNGKKYWQGNLNCRIQGGGKRFNDVANCFLNNITISNYTVKNIISGGILFHNESYSDNNETGTFYNNRLDNGVNSLEYNAEDPGKDWALNENSSILITNFIVELE